MRKVPMTITVRGREHEWSFTFYSDPKFMQDWLDDGLDVTRPIYVIPAPVAGFGLSRLWCFFVDAYRYFTRTQ